MIEKRKLSGREESLRIFREMRGDNTIRFSDSFDEYLDTAVKPLLIVNGAGVFAQDIADVAREVSQGVEEVKKKEVLPEKLTEEEREQVRKFLDERVVDLETCAEYCGAENVYALYEVIGIGEKEFEDEYYENIFNEVTEDLNDALYKDKELKRCSDDVRSVVLRWFIKKIEEYLEQRRSLLIMEIVLKVVKAIFDGEVGVRDVFDKTDYPESSFIGVMIEACKYLNEQLYGCIYKKNRKGELLSLYKGTEVISYGSTVNEIDYQVVEEVMVILRQINDQGTRLKGVQEELDTEKKGAKKLDERTKIRAQQIENDYQVKRIARAKAKMELERQAAIEAEAKAKAKVKTEEPTKPESDSSSQDDGSAIATEEERGGAIEGDGSESPGEAKDNEGVIADTDKEGGENESDTSGDAAGTKKVTDDEVSDSGGVEEGAEKEKESKGDPPSDKPVMDIHQPVREKTEKTLTGVSGVLTGEGGGEKSILEGGDGGRDVSIVDGEPKPVEGVVSPEEEQDVPDAVLSPPKPAEPEKEPEAVKDPVKAPEELPGESIVEPAEKIDLMEKFAKLGLTVFDKARIECLVDLYLNKDYALRKDLADLVMFDDPEEMIALANGLFDTIQKQLGSRAEEIGEQLLIQAIALCLRHRHADPIRVVLRKKHDQELASLNSLRPLLDDEEFRMLEAVKKWISETKDTYRMSGDKVDKRPELLHAKALARLFDKKSAENAPVLALRVLTRMMNDVRLRAETITKKSIGWKSRNEECLKNINTFWNKIWEMLKAKAANLGEVTINHPVKSSWERCVDRIPSKLQYLERLLAINENRKTEIVRQINGLNIQQGKEEEVDSDLTSQIRSKEREKEAVKKNIDDINRRVDRFKELMDEINDL